MSHNTSCQCPGPPEAISDQTLGWLSSILIALLSLTILVLTLLGAACLKKQRSLVRTIRELRGNRFFKDTAPQLEVPIMPAMPVTAQVEEVQKPPSQTQLQQGNTVRCSKKLWKGLQQEPRFTKSDLNLLQLIKAGKEGVFYQARMAKGTCKGHSMFTCKISKEGVRSKHMDTEVSIMRKLVHHKNILQLLDWNTTEEPYILIMEYVSYGTLRTYLQTNKAHLSADPELQSLLTIASYHIALAMQHLRSKMIVHCDLALRNIMVNRFPWEVKVAEFGLARDLTRMTSRHSSRWRNPRGDLATSSATGNNSFREMLSGFRERPAQRVPLRWYPPEYFKNNYYSFKGDVWAFGIVLWEMQTFGTLPYPDLETSEAVVYHICVGLKNANPEGCRPEMLHIIQDCWQEPYSLRPSFTDVVNMLETIIENDADYVDVESPRILVKDEAEYHEARCLRAASVSMEDNSNTI